MNKENNYKKIKSYFEIEDMHLALIEIVNQIKQSNWNPDVVISVNRGGCVPGVYLSHILNVPHYVINVQLRDNLAQNNLSAIDQNYNSKNNILIIDDINDTGATFDLIKNYINYDILKFRFGCLIENKSSKFKSNYWGKLIDKKLKPTWIVFPWERDINSSK